MKRKVCYITGTRADFGLMKSTLQALAARSELDLSVLITGMHLAPEYGSTVQEIEATGLRIAGRLPVALHPATGGTMARAIGSMVTGFTDLLGDVSPDVLLLLGDRGEMLAGAIAAIHLNIPIAHIHGGERSGTVDEPVRHAISKLSHIHFTATEESRDRLVRMGERPSAVHVTGAPGLDSLMDFPGSDRGEVASAFGLDAERPFALVLYHPVVQRAAYAEAETREILEAVSKAGLQAIVLAPNADGGSDGVRAALAGAHRQNDFAFRGHLSRAEFLAALESADVLVGNSSSGIIEASSFGTPVVNIGPRQNLRERNLNTIDASPEGDDVLNALKLQLEHGRFERRNVYGDGRAGERIVNLLAGTPLDEALLMKANEY